MRHLDCPTSLEVDGCAPEPPSAPGSLFEYGLAIPCVAALIAPAPFFWAPPVSVAILMNPFGSVWPWRIKPKRPLTAQDASGNASRNADNDNVSVDKTPTGRKASAAGEAWRKCA